MGAVSRRLSNRAQLLPVGYSRLSLALPLYWVAHEYVLHDWWASELECQCCLRCNLVHQAIRIYDTWPVYRDGSLHRHAILVAVDRDGVLWIVDALLYLGEGGHGDDIEEWRRESSLS